jgi:hypothetical protein
MLLYFLCRIIILLFVLHYYSPLCLTVILFNCFSILGTRFFALLLSSLFYY